MARNKVSSFSADEGLFDRFRETQPPQPETDSKDKSIGSTQGKKGQKLKRINMAFSDLNHEFIMGESRKNGISATAFVNRILDEYRNKD